MHRLEKLRFVVVLVLRFLLGGAILIALLNQNWINLALSVLTLFLTYLPAIISRRIRIDFPIEFEIAIIIFIYASLYLGEVKAYYARFWWWDIFLHTFSAMIMGAIGFSLVYILNKERQISLKMSPAFVGIFSFSFAMSLGGLWEIIEFLLDRSFGWNMQKSGLVDTMTDMMVDAAGALIVSFFGYLYMKGKSKLFKKVEDKIIQRNPHIFKDERD